MYEKLQRLKEKITREHLMVIGALLMTIIISLWINEKPQSQEEAPSELGTVIPKGFLMVPLELSNRASLAGLITKNAVIDVFQPGQKAALAKNLRILKINQGEEILFGALVPTEMAGLLQEVFARPKLRGAMGTMNAGPTKFNFHPKHSPLLTEIQVEED